ncbi:MAG TPA: double zinc ribbon domain-containing protein [Stellaceae bacterium]|nr:double zinc ribbon domain-containing protein [Stellaceae bacterium]
MDESAISAPRFGGGFKRLGRLLVDAVLPPRCLACGQSVDEPDALCGRCWAGMVFFAPPWCARRGLVYPISLSDSRWIVFSRSRVPSSAPISRGYPATSAARIAASPRVGVTSPRPPRAADPTTTVRGPRGCGMGCRAEQRPG